MQIIQVSGGNLFAIAAQYLNDATQWIRIAQLNGLTDPALPLVPMSLTIPDINPQLTGGLPPQ
jgi:nucleoid-associated protein YgaU